MRGDPLNTKTKWGWAVCCGLICLAPLGAQDAKWPTPGDRVVWERDASLLSTSQLCFGHGETLGLVKKIDFVSAEYGSAAR